MNQLSSNDVPSDIAKRITSAADQLYEENGKTAFPNVDTVRRRARVNMNDASAVMRTWRRAQTALAAPLQAAIPDVVQGASQTMLVAVWTAATESANNNLQMAQAGWEQERAEAEACRVQLARAFDGQTEELALLQRHVEDFEKQIAAHTDELKVLMTTAEEWKQAASTAETKAATAEAKAATAEARSAEISVRADDLRAELSHAHVFANQQRQEAKERLETAESTIEGLREELRQTSAINSDMRDELARLQGQAEAFASRSQAPPLPPDGNAPAPPKRTAATKSKTPNGT